MKLFRHALFLSVIAVVLSFIWRDDIKEGWKALSGAAHAEKDGFYTVTGSKSCGKYLDAYAKATLTGESAYEGPHQSWKVFGYINGYLTAYNQYVHNGKKNIRGSMSVNDTYRWTASWCRDNPSKHLVDGIGALTVKMEK